MVIVQFTITREFQGEQYSFGLLFNPEPGSDGLIVARAHESTEKWQALIKDLHYSPIELDTGTVKREDVEGKYMVVRSRLSIIELGVKNREFAFILKAEGKSKVLARFAGPPATFDFLNQYSLEEQYYMLGMAISQAINQFRGKINEELHLNSLTYELLDKIN